VQQKYKDRVTRGQHKDRVCVQHKDKDRVGGHHKDKIRVQHKDKDRVRSWTAHGQLQQHRCTLAASCVIYGSTGAH
jgi:hypothetical protein